MKQLFFCCLIFAFFFDSNCNSKIENGKWYQSLPDCPCQNPDLEGIKIGDGWAKDKGEIEKYHSGAYTCFRSYPFTKTSEGKSGQQCCYDQNGNLITNGSGAGTPDKISICEGENELGIMKIRTMGIIGHYIKDLKPWENAGSSSNAWKIYNKTWIPNQGKNCK